jgi:prepilin-type N-terminal cleavage/methylation domain-containing protein
MLSRRRASPGHACSEAGFTLIEVLVAMIAGVIVTGALFTILDIALSQSTRVRNETYSDQLGRTAMRKIVDELQSACYYVGITPVKKESTGTALVFSAAYGAESEPKSAYEHEIQWQAETGSSTLGTLTDYSWKNSGGAWPEFTFPTINVSNPTGSAVKPTAVLIATHVSAASENGATVPIFRYYRYAHSSTSSSTTPVGTLETTPLATPIGQSEAASVAAVRVSFATAATTSTSAQLERSMDLTSETTFAMGAPSSEIPIEDSPCH